MESAPSLRIEGLCGPQRTLYRRNATGGGIKFISQEPTDRNEGAVSIGYASYNETNAKGMLNIAPADGIRVRAVANYRNREDGFVKNIVPGGRDLDTVDALSGRVRVSMDLSPELTFGLSAYAVREENL